jgi:hypothetical protein
MRQPENLAPPGNVNQAKIQFPVSRIISMYLD